MNMENSRGKEGNGTEKSREEQMSSQPSTSFTKTSARGTKRKAPMNKEVPHPKMNPGYSDIQNSPKETPIPPLPSELPPVTALHRNVLRAWCQQLKISSKGQKLETYKRLCEFAYPQQKNIPNTAKEARLSNASQTNSKKSRKKTSLRKPKEKACSQGSVPLEAALTSEELPALSEPPALYEEVSTTVVTTSAQEAILASWARIAASAGQEETVESPPEASGGRWCVVHGRSLPANRNGWVRLQFHAGQTWVPEKKGRVSALFLLPACTFPPPHMEDNLLCPKCVQRNKILSKSLQWD